MSSLFCRAFSVKPSVFNEFEIVPYHESFCVITLLACANWTTHLRLPPPPHPYISLDIFKSAIFISGYGFRPHVSGESGMRIRSLEWKFFMKRFESGIVCTLNPDIILSGDLARSSPVLYRECCIQDDNLVPRCSQGRARCKFRALYDAYSVANILRGVLGTRVNPDTCRIRVDGQIRFAYRKRVDVRIF